MSMNICIKGRVGITPVRDGLQQSILADLAVFLAWGITTVSAFLPQMISQAVIDGRNVVSRNRRQGYRR